MNDSKLPVRRLYRTVDDRMLGGVAGGLADYLKVDPVGIRLLFAALTLFSGGVFLLVYLAGWMLLPEAPVGTAILARPKSRLHRSAGDRMVGGICGGLAETFHLDPALVRLAMVAAIVFTGGAALLGYLVLWIVLPLEIPASPESAASPESSLSLPSGGLHEPPVDASPGPIE